MSDIKFKLFGNTHNPLTYLELMATDGVSAYASQSGEDITLYRLFQKKTDGFYIDVGAFHPIVYSNTYMFHKLYAWRGINIDASDKTIDLYNKFRPNDINLNIAVSNVEGETKYWQFDNSPSVNTISPDNVDRQVSRGIQLTQEKVMKTYRLETVFKQYVPEGQVIDLLNVDVEGVDYEALESNNWNIYRPRVVLVEDYEVLRTGKVGETKISEFMLRQGYQFVSHLFDTSIYAEPDFIDKVIRRVKGINHTRYVSVGYRHGQNAEIDARVDALIGDYPPLLRLKKEVDKLSKENKLLVEQTRQGLVEFMQEQASLRVAYEQKVKEFERIQIKLEDAEKEFHNLLQDFRRKSESYDNLSAKHQQLKANYDLLSVTQGDLNNLQKQVAKTTALDTKLLLNFEDKNVDEVLADLLPIVINELENANRRLMLDINEQQTKLQSLRKDVKSEQKRTLSVQQATQAIFDSRSFRSVNWLKTRVAPSQFPPVELVAPQPVIGQTIEDESQIPDSRKNNILSPHQIRLTATKLYTLGFIDRALEELEYNLKYTTSPYAKHAAAWELALWYSQFEDDNNIQRTLNYLRLAKDGMRDIKTLQKIALVEAHCYLNLDNPDRARKVVQAAMEKGVNNDLFLAMANCETELEAKLHWINQALVTDGLTPIQLTHINPDQPFYDQLINQAPVELSLYDKDMPQPKITIILTSYNASDIIGTAIESFIQQTWTNWELLIVDDCSQDNTVEVIQSFVDRDPRIKLILAEKNGGTNVARNIALKQATGEFVTCNDADDWSHPQKLEVQVVHLINNPEIVGNMSRQSRMSSQLQFFRRPRYGFFIQMNVSSFMFRRQQVVQEVGYWDTVRFLADGEYIARIRAVFGSDRVVEVENSLLSFPRQEAGSLTTHNAFGYHGYQMGISREYAEQYTYFYKVTEKPYIDFPMTKRPFAVPEPMLPERNRDNPRRHFDVILISEFRLSGGTVESNIEEIKAQVQGGLKTGIVPLYRYMLSPEHHFDPKVREYIDGENVEVLVYGQKVTCDTLIIRYPPVLQEWQKYLPDIDAKTVRIIINQTPYRDYSENKERVYHIRDCVENIERYFDTKGIWHPIGPVIRQTLLEHHKEELQTIPLSDDDWLNIIDVDDWKRPARPPKSSRPRIGRHARDQYVKWPENADKLATVYPITDDYEVHILGGAETVKNMLGDIPANWHVLPFNSIHPREFLAQLDVFVYYTHSDWVEAFGRVIFEAMAAGVPVILPYQYRPLFEEAAIYADPHEVRAKIASLMADDVYYDQQVKRAWDYVNDKFGHVMHLKRLAEGLPSDRLLKK